MKKFFIIVALLAVGCGTEIEPSIEPPQPIIYQRTLPPDPVDHGLFADVSAERPAIWIEWNSDASKKTSGYEIYRSSDDTLGGDGLLKNRILVGRNEPSNDLQQKIDTLTRDTINVIYGKRYYYQVRAFNRSATNRYTFSKPSPVRHYRLISAPVPLRPSTNGVDVPQEGFEFSWTYPDQQEGGFFQIVLERVNPPGVIWASDDITSFGEVVIERYPTTAPKLVPSILYRWRVKRITSDGGSSSYWQQFSVK